MKQYSLSVHIFTRDLRLYDNTALVNALQQSDRVLPVFIFDERQLSNPFKGNNSFEFMVNSLVELNEELKQKGSQLNFYKGIAHEIINKLIEKINVGAVFANRDYTPFSRERDNAIADVCRYKNIPFNLYADALLNEPEQVYKTDGNPYTVFTPFMKKAMTIKVKKPDDTSLSNYYNETVKSPSRIYDPKSLIRKSNINLRMKGGRKEGLSLLKKIESLCNYEHDRNLPSVNGTSLLSAHHKFGTVSIRETYQRVIEHFGKEHPLINELYWRDFFTHIVYHYPHVLGNSFNPKYAGIEWENNVVRFEKWCRGQTGFPIVDAGMRELITTGYMHNRVRMIVASFLVKDLHIDWRWGERFLANHLVDYDPAVNNGNWQWAASIGCDAQPYFRIFNPWSQQKKFDPECVYIKKWVPELNDLSASQIHNLHDKSQNIGKYPKPIIDHKTQADLIREKFKRL